MLVITDIQLAEYEFPEICIQHHNDIKYRGFTADTIPEPVEITSEMIKGQIFCNARGEKICIGMSKEVQDAIGLPFEVYSNLQDELSQANARLMNLSERLTLEIERMAMFKAKTFWQRLKWAFFGDSDNA